MPGPDPKPARPWRRVLVTVLIVFAIFAGLVAYVFFGQWMDVSDALPPEAGQAFAAALAEAGERPAFLELVPGGGVTVSRDTASAVAPGFDRLSLLAWSSSDGKLIRVDYPRWFVRLKTSSSVNLGTAISLFRRDWNDIDLQITYDDLVERGPSLILDSRARDGSRIVLWTARRGD